MRLLAGVALTAALSSGAGALGAQAPVEAPSTTTGIGKWVPASPDPRHVFVLDSAHLLSAAAVRALQDSSRALQAETGADLVWVTLPSLGGRAIEEAALYVGRQWRAASKGAPGDALANRGLVVLYVPDRTTVSGGKNFRVEVARGLEGTITDSRSRRITLAMRDSLRAKRFDGAYAAGFAAAATLVRQDVADRQRRAEVAAAGPEAVVAPAPASVPERETPTWPVTLVAFAVIAALLMIARSVLAKRGGPARDDGGRGTRTMGFPAAGGVDPLAALTALSVLDDDESRRRSAFDFGSSSSSFDSGSSGSDGGSTGGGDGYSGGGSSDSI